MKISLWKLNLLIATVFLFVAFASAQTEREKGIELFKQGKNKEAVAALEKASKENKTDAAVWNYLGLAYLKSDNLKKALKALEKAVSYDAQNATYQTNLAYAYLLGNKLNKAQEESTKAIALNGQNADAFYVRGSASLAEGKYNNAIDDADHAVAVNSDYSLAYILKSDALLSNFGKCIGIGVKPIDYLNLLEQSREVLKKCLKECKNNSYIQLQQQRLDAVETFYNYFEKRKDADLGEPSAVSQPTLPNPNFVPILITSKPHPSYTDEARQAGVTGTIKILTLFAGSGHVTHTLVLKGLGYGLNENAVKVARAIKFTPALENGKPVSQVKIIEYSFAIY